MFRFFIIIVFSFCMVVPFLALFHRFLGLEDALAGYLSFFFSWIVLPYTLLKLWKKKPNIESLPFNIHDPIMKEMIVKSRSQINKLIEGLSKENLEAFVKIPISISNKIEYIWVIAHTINQNKIIVSVSPEILIEMPEGTMARQSVPLEDIKDWMLQEPSGITFGGYTILAIARIYERDYGKLSKKYLRELELFVDLKWHKALKQ